jgi:pimeloyl-ACP methyl ester carboxylesterase
MEVGSIAVDPASVRCPTLVLGPEADHITPVSVQRKIAARYNSEYLEAAGHVHLPMLEPGGERRFADVLDGLANVG